MNRLQQAKMMEAKWERAEYLATTEDAQDKAAENFLKWREIRKQEEKKVALNIAVKEYNAAKAREDWKAASAAAEKVWALR